ncbi:Uncharacterized protein Fot_07962 [Forsythia ovata]|uniref:Uncharacterized protein n=1 Tax=Forsythia ovata TaxID=205694 RepID=A0ABD1X0A4_9LAMI
MDITSKGTEVTRREGISGLQQQKSQGYLNFFDLAALSLGLSRIFADNQTKEEKGETSLRKNCRKENRLARLQEHLDFTERKKNTLLKSEEDKTKLQNHIEQTREKLGDVKREGEALNKKLVKVENDIQVLAMENMEINLCPIMDMIILNHTLQSKLDLREQVLIVEKPKKQLRSCYCQCS